MAGQCHGTSSASRILEAIWAVAGVSLDFLRVGNEQSSRRYNYFVEGRDYSELCIETTALSVWTLLDYSLLSNPAPVVLSEHGEAIPDDKSCD